MAPHNLTLSVIGASLLWVGWFEFNAGSALAANATAGMAMAVTQIATAAAALAWMFVEWARLGKPSVLGILSGAVAGLVAITPASGFVDPQGALLIGVIAGVVCWSATSLKHALGYDDALDAFGIHASAASSARSSPACSRSRRSAAGPARSKATSASWSSRSSPCSPRSSGAAWSPSSCSS